MNTTRDDTQQLKRHKQASARQAVERFVARFQPSYRELVYYTALPLVLTPELVHYLRHEFLRAARVPWVAEVDLLLSELCRPVGYELYAMETAVRAYAIEAMKRDVGRERMQQVAQLLLQYAAQLRRSRPSLSRQEIQAQQWTAMVYLDTRRRAAAQQMAQAFSGAVRPPGASPDRAGLAQLTRLVDTLSPELGRYPDLVEYARDVARLLHDPAGLPPARLRQKRRAAGVDLPDLRPLAQSPSTTGVTEPQSREWQDPLTGMEFVWVPPGRFMMGQTETDKEYLIQVLGEEDYKKYDYDTEELPRHEVHIAQGFWMGKYPVTQKQWLKVMGENPSDFNKEKVGEAWREHPVEQVSWDDAQKFLKKLTDDSLSGGELSHDSPPGRGRGGSQFRLPSEAEWEYACRAGAETMFCFGDDVEELKEYAWYDANSDGKTHPVGQCRPNAWGLYDMHGNVWEWCADDWHDSYEGAPDDGSAWKSLGEEKVKLLRGGSWSVIPRYCRCAYRYGDSRDAYFRNFGFRVVRGRVGRTQ